MAVGKLAKWIVIGIVVLLGLTYGVYAYAYQGGYSVEVKVPVNSADNGHGYAWISPTQMTMESTPTSFWGFLGDLSVAGPSGRNQTVNCDLNMGGHTYSQHAGWDMMPGSGPTMFTFGFSNIPAGTGSLHISIVEEMGNRLVYSYTWAVTVP